MLQILFEHTHVIGAARRGVCTYTLPCVCLQGVYFGWAQIDAPEGWPAVDSAVHKMVMNVGRRPTVNAGEKPATLPKSS